MKRLICVLLVCLMLAGCGGPAASGAEDGLETIDVVLDWYPNAVHAFLYQAMEKGYFEEEGLKVNLLFPANASDPITMPAVGKADIGLYYQMDTIIAIANEGIPAVSLGAVVREPISIVCSLKEKGITTPADLIGKTVGHAGTQFGEVAMAQLIRSAGAELGDIELLDVGFDLMSAMTTGNVDATFGCFLNHEIPALEEQGFPMDYIDLTHYGVPSYYALLMVTGQGQLEKKRDKYTRFLRACQKGFADMQADPEGSLTLMLDHQSAENFPLTENVERQSFEVLLPIMEQEGEPFLSQEAQVWQESMDWLFENGMIEGTFAPEEVMVDLLGH